MQIANLLASKRSRCQLVEASNNVASRPLHSPRHANVVIILSSYLSMSSSSESSAPSTAAIALATGILCALGGYLVGQASSLGLVGSGTRKSGANSSWPNSYDVTVHPDSSDEELMKSLKGEGGPDLEDDESEDENQGELKAFTDNKEECKLILVVRTDLGMTKGCSLNSFILSPDTALT